MTGLLGRVNPLVLMALGVAGLIASFAVRDLAAAIAVLGCYAVLGLIFLPRRSGPPIRYLAVVLGSVSIAYSTWLLGDHDLRTAAVAGLRIVVLALPGVALAPLVDPSTLADHLGQRLRLPARFVVAFAAALQRIDQLGDTWHQLNRARRARGIGPGRGPVSRGRHVSSVTFGLLVATLRQSTTMSIAMDARGFAAAHRRTWAEPATWTILDTAMLAVGAVVAMLPYMITIATR